MGIKEPFPQESAGCWGIMGNENDISPHYPMKGYMIKAFWYKIKPNEEGDPDWKEVDRRIDAAIRANDKFKENNQFADIPEPKVGLALNIGPDSPDWIYKNVPKLLTDKGHGDPDGKVDKKDVYAYPYPIEKKGNMYLEHVKNFIKELADYIKSMELPKQKQILFVQANIGSSGDISGYKGEILKVEDPSENNPNPDDYQFNEEDSEFKKYVDDVWDYYIKQFKETDIKILFNTANDYKKMQENIPKVIKKYGDYSPMIKCGNPTHGFQLNEESLTSNYLMPVLNEPQENGVLIKARGERGDSESGFWQKYLDWNEYWLVLYALHHGMDIINYRSKEWEETRNGEARFIEAFEKFDQYAGYDKVSDAPGAFCALRYGIDSADEKWEQAGFGAADKRDKKRMKDIYDSKLNKDNRKRGAKFKDPEHAINGPKNNREAKDINDVGHMIIRGNYNKFMEQIDPDGTSVGWWSVGPKKQPYGRFARGFDPDNLGDEMHFKIDNNFFKGDTNKGDVTIRVIYFDDKDKSSFKVNYSTKSGNSETAGRIKCEGSKEWHTEAFDVNDFSEEGTFTQKAQLQIVRTSGAPILHMIEVLKRP